MSTPFFRISAASFDEEERPIRSIDGEIQCYPPVSRVSRNESELRSYSFFFGSADDQSNEETRTKEERIDHILSVSR